MNTQRMQSRNKCPACGGERVRQMYQCPYGNDPIDSYLRRFYGARYTPETLVHESYVADKCESCEFVFQRFVPNPEMLTTIYEGSIRVSGAECSMFSLGGSGWSDLVGFCRLKFW